MKSWQTWLNILLVLAIALMILFWPSKPQPERITQLETAQKEKQHKIDSLVDRNHVILTQYQKDVVSWDSARSAFKSKLNAKLARQEKIKTVVLQTVDTLPVVKTYILRQDSINSDLSERVESLEFALASTTKTLVSVRENFEDQLKFTQGKYSDALAEAEVYRKGWKKEQKKVKLFKVLTVAGTVLGLVGGSQL